MATRSGRPPGRLAAPNNGSAARLQEIRGSRSTIPSRVFVVILAAAAVRATVFNDRFHENINAEVAPLAQFLRDETIGMGADAAHPVAFDSSGFTTQNVSEIGRAHV